MSVDFWARVCGFMDCRDGSVWFHGLFACLLHGFMDCGMTVVWFHGLWDDCCAVSWTGRWRW
eukprot:956378-Rhodomonas_salina.1